MKILFLIKLSSEYNEANSFISKAGLRNSAKFVVDAINEFPRTEAILEIVTDQNRIHMRLKHHKPDMCILEAIWVNPVKLRELIELHPHIKFIIRVHSRVPFLGMESNAITWIKEYGKYATVSFNHIQTSRELEKLGVKNVYLPNIYPTIKFCPEEQKHLARKHFYKIGCFGAIRPYKNQLSQAVAAILFGEKYNTPVHFYINSTRVEQRGESILKNIRSLFENTRHKLIEIQWLEHDEFIRIIAQMDVCMQVSYTETFNIVTADAVAAHVPIVASEQIDWLSCEKADPNNESDMVKVIRNMIEKRCEVVEDNINDLAAYNHHAILKWFRFVER